MKNFNININSQLESTSLDTEDLGVDYWVVNKEFTCVLDTAKDQYVIIPQGFLTDGASVPRMFWSFLS